ncbi:MAG: hypothetical protein Q7W05_14110 [Deltaproteobacteria bacterium]|nr:hypothetical protein [Deltaproteobacteria bacterium]
MNTLMIVLSFYCAIMSIVVSIYIVVRRRRYSVVDKIDVYINNIREYLSTADIGFVINMDSLCRHHKAGNILTESIEPEILLRLITANTSHLPKAKDQERRQAALSALDLDEAARARLVEELAQIAAHLDRLTSCVEEDAAECPADMADSAAPSVTAVPGQTPPKIKKYTAEN